MSGLGGWVPAALGQFQPAAHAVLRVGAGALFFQHGVQKLFGLLGGFAGTPGATAPLMSWLGLAGVLETAGGSLLVLGLVVRPTAVVLVLEMLTAYFWVHFPRGGAPIQNGGELALLFGSIFVFLAAAGAGPYSLDALLRRRGPPA